MAEDGEIVHGDDERDAAANRPAIGRAVQHVGAARAMRKHVRIPGEVEPQRSGPPGREAAQPLDRHLALDAREQRVEIARRAGARQLERRDVDGDLHRADPTPPDARGRSRAT